MASRPATHLVVQRRVDRVKKLNVKILLTVMIVVGHALYYLKKMLTAEVRYTCKIVYNVTAQCFILDSGSREECRTNWSRIESGL